MKQNESAKEWQIREYSRIAEFKLTIPQQFLMLCKLLNVTPRQMIVDFMDNLACSSWKREGRDIAKQKLVEYIITHNYGREYFSEEDIRRIFRELDAIGMLYPVNASQELIEEHTRWRENYHAWWFKKWFERFNRAV